MSQRSQWRRFVEQHRRELHHPYPCAMPTGRRRCPKHRGQVGRLTGICKSCRDELYVQLAADYVHHQKGELA